MTETVNIDVCIATFQRPLMLSRLLDSLIKQNLKGLTMRIIVVDNDGKQSASATVSLFQKKCGLVVVYDVEPLQNISLARNRALSHVRSEYFAFVDDDEVVSIEWLRTLVVSMRSYRADVVFGPVKSILPIDAPDWANKLFFRPHRKTGETVPFGGAGNVMLKRAILTEMPAHFDATFGLSGGEDTDFFYRLHLLGKHLIWCDEASADEYVSQDRVTLKWIRRRGFRSGQTYNRIVVSRYSFPKKVVWFATKTLQIFSGVIVAPVIRCLSYSTYVTLTVRVAAAAGQISHCFSAYKFEEYKAKST
jgi:succinoglycan biosynthesis protein ExoM